jgi:cytochrome P450
MHHPQVTSPVGLPSMLSAKTGDPVWRLVRKGVAPAFNPQNIRQVHRRCTDFISSASIEFSAFQVSKVLTQNTKARRN